MTGSQIYDPVIDLCFGIWISLILYAVFNAYGFYFFIKLIPKVLLIITNCNSKHNITTIFAYIINSILNQINKYAILFHFEQYSVLLYLKVLSGKKIRVSRKFYHVSPTARLQRSSKIGCISNSWGVYEQWSQYKENAVNKHCSCWERMAIYS